MDTNYAKAFRIVRAATGLQQAELAERLPITASQLSLIESGKREPSLKSVEALSAAIGIPTALITLLASAPGELDKQRDSDVSDLARALLRLLISTGGEKAAPVVE